jgi:hypothetical protein
LVGRATLIEFDLLVQKIAPEIGPEAETDEAHLSGRKIKSPSCLNNSGRIADVSSALADGTSAIQIDLNNYLNFD